MDQVPIQANIWIQDQWVLNVISFIFTIMAIVLFVAIIFGIITVIYRYMMTKRNKVH